MRILLVLTFILSFAPSAFASKARLGALQNARFLRDTQTIFLNPAHVNSLGQYFTAEFGDTTNTTTNPKAEGGLLVKRFGGNFGLYLGHMDTMQVRLRTPESYFFEQNPVEVFYGTGSFGGSLFFSRDKKRTTSEEQRTVGARFGYAANNLEVFTTIDLFASAMKSATADYKRKIPTINVGAEYAWSDLYFFGDITWARSRQDIATPATNDAPYDSRTFEVGAQDRSLSAAGRTFYYGFSLRHDTLSKNKKKKQTFSLPVVIGIEHEVTDWSVLRASITQNFLIGHTRDQTQASPLDRKDSIANNTTVAAGGGLKFKGFLLDGFLAASSSGTLNANNLLTQASLTYNF